MPRNGSGSYTLPAGNPVVTGTVISSTVQNNTTSDIATALTNSLAKDGQTTPTANLPMGGFKLTGLGAGSASTDSANLGQAQAQAYILLGTVAGTDTITATTNPVTTAYAAGQTFRFVTAGANTGAVTININSLGAKAITKLGTSALVSGDLISGALYQIVYDGTRFQVSDPLGNLTVPGNTTLGDAGADTVTINASTVAVPNNLNFDSNTLFVDSSNNRVGVGTASPSTTFQVDNSSATFGQEQRWRHATFGNSIIGASSGKAHIATDMNTLSFHTASNLGTDGSAVPSNEWARITSTGDFQMNSGYGSVTTVYGCRAFVNFNGAGVVAVIAGGNVSSVTDNGVGDYTINFTNAMASANYASIFGARGTSDTANHTVTVKSATAPTTTACRIIAITSGVGVNDLTNIYASFYL